MKRTSTFITLVLAVLAISTQVAPAQSNSGHSGDPRVEAALNKLGFKYQQDADGDFKVGMRMADGRTQVAWINSHTEKYGNLEIREIMSPAYQSNGPLAAAVANRLLEDSGQTKLGAWQTLHSKDKYLAVFSAKIAANSDADTLGASLRIVLRNADDMEKELTGKDNF